MEYDPFVTQGGDPAAPPHVLPEVGSQATANILSAIHESQRSFAKVTDGLYDLWWNLPTLTHRQVDSRVQDVFRDLMKVAPAIGVSQISIRPLRECCGKKRAWSTDLQFADPDKTIIAEVPREHRKIGWGLGDVVYRITRLWNADHCDRCERRRIWLNNIFRKK